MLFTSQHSRSRVGMLAPDGISATRPRTLSHWHRTRCAKPRAFHIMGAFSPARQHYCEVHGTRGKHPGGVETCRRPNSGRAKPHAQVRFVSTYRVVVPYRPFSTDCRDERSGKLGSRQARSRSTPSLPSHATEIRKEPWALHDGDVSVLVRRDAL